MAVFNGELFFAEAIESVLSQTCAYFELIVIDDQSTDNSWKIATEYAKKDHRIELIQTPENRGPAAARNLGLRAARGEYVAIMDGDDISLPHRFEYQLRAFTSHEIDVCASNVILINSVGKKLFYRDYHPDVGRIINQEIPLCNPTVMMRRSLLETYGSFSEKHHVTEDYELYLRLWSQGARFYICPEYLLYYRLHEANRSRTQYRKKVFQETVSTKLYARQAYGLTLGLRGWLRLLAEYGLSLMPDALLSLAFSAAPALRYARVPEKKSDTS